MTKTPFVIEFVSFKKNGPDILIGQYRKIGFKFFNKLLIKSYVDYIPVTAKPFDQYRITNNPN